MGEKGTTYPSQVSPAGVVKYAWLERPDNRFGKNEYSLTLTMDANDPKVKEWGARIKALKPGVKHYGGFKIEKETGRLEVSFKSKKKPSVFMDAKLNLLPAGKYPAKGSIVKVECSPHGYDLQGGCVVLYIQKVQVLKLVEWSSKTLFQPEEGYTVTPEEEGFVREPSDTGAAPAGDRPPDEEPPPSEEEKQDEDPSLPF